MVEKSDRDCDDSGAVETHPSEAKRTILEQLLEQGTVLATLDARVEGVSVPIKLQHDPKLRLNLSYRFGLPIKIDDWGVHPTLTFGPAQFACHLPWSCVYVLVSHSTGKPVVFPADIPTDLEHEDAPPTARASTDRSQPTLSVVAPSPHPDASTGDLAPPVTSAPTKSRAHLRLIK